MYKVLILPQAKEDIREAALWYNKQSEGLGIKFVSVILQNVQFIRQNPFAAGLRYNSEKECFILKK